MAAAFSSNGSHYLTDRRESLLGAGEPPKPPDLTANRRALVARLTAMGAGRN